jgi:AAA family ATP:ADP antiporter
LFATIGIGGSLGAITGPRLAKLADTWTLMIAAGVLLAVCLALFYVVERSIANRAAAPPPIAPGGGYSLIRRDRYLVLIAVLVIVASLVNTVGELVLSTVATEHVAMLEGDARREAIKAFYADLYGWVNLVGFLAQAFLVSRLLAVANGRAALYVVPAIAVIGYGAMSLVGGLAMMRLVKIIENAADYSIQQTTRQALFLPLSREAKYKAKTTIDTFFVRFGDLVAAVVVGVGVRYLDLPPSSLAALNAGLAVIWLGAAFALAQHRRRSAALGTLGVAPA